MRDVVCFYHGDCPDGFAAAWVVEGKLGRDAVEFVPMQYQQELTTPVDGKHVIMVDFSFREAELIEIAKQAKTVLILDHHKSAAKELGKLLKGGSTPEKVNGSWRAAFEGGEASYPHNIFGIFDEAKSGARLAFDVMYAGCRVALPELIAYVEDRDLWKHELEDSQQVNKWIMSFEHDFDVYDQISQRLSREDSRPGILMEAAAIDRSFKRQMDKTLRETTREMVIDGYRVPAANVPHFMASDASTVLGEGVPFVALYFDQAGGRKFSLRVREGDVDVAAIARKFGGGGHAKAAGFVAPAGWEGDGL